MKKLLALILLLALAGAAYQLYPHFSMRLRTSELLTQVEAAVATKNRETVAVMLNQLLTTDAAVALDVSFVSPMQSGNAPAVQQEFTRANFIGFIDNILYTLTDYSYSSRITDFVLHEDATSADVDFSAEGWADGASMFAGLSMQMRYVVKASCAGVVVFAAESAQMSDLSCTVELRMTPKPEEISKIKDPQALQKLLTAP